MAAQRPRAVVRARHVDWLIGLRGLRDALVALLNAAMNGLLLSTLIIPLAAALVLLVFRGMFSQSGARQFALVASLAALFDSIALANAFFQLPAESGPRAPVQPRYSTTYHWLAYGDAAQGAPGQSHLQFDFILGLDGISLVLILLTTLLTVSCVL